MTGSLRQLLRGGAIGRRVYFLSGTTLLACKILIDWSAAHWLFHRPWSPAEYIAPGSSLGMVLSEPGERLFRTTMLFIAVPFIGMGVSLTAMRLRSIGVSAAWTVLFFVPGINFILFAILCGLPGREVPLARATVAAKSEPASAPPLSYGINDLVPLPFLARMMPADPLAAKAVAVFVPVGIALLATYLSILYFSSYGWGVFVGVPFAIGLMSAVLYGARDACTVKECVGVGCLALTVYGALLFLIAFEGVVCLIMAAPLVYPVAIAGALVGSTLRRRPSRLADAGRIVWLMILLLPIFIGAEKLAGPEAPLFSVTSTIEVDTPPERVWAHVIGFGELSPPTELLFRAGVAYPLRAQIQGHGPGALRRCVFSTGAFEEPITVWDEPRLLKFDVRSNPPPMKELSLYHDVHPPHLDHFLVSSGGEFRLIPLPKGRCRLEGTTWYRHHMWPASYWQLWSDYIIHRIHLRVLEHVKALSETSS